MRISTLAIGCVLAAIATVSSAVAGEGAIVEREATLKAEAQTSSQTICLGDLVADGWLQSRCAVDAANCCLWSLKGSLERTLKRSEIQKELSKVNFGGVGVTLKGAETVDVKQTRRELTSDEIKARISAKLAEKLNDDV